MINWQINNIDDYLSIILKQRAALKLKSVGGTLC